MALACKTSINVVEGGNQCLGQIVNFGGVQRIVQKQRGGAVDFPNKGLATKSEEQQNWIKHVEGIIGKNVLLEK
uniref:Uncharacterized protein n=1 Tax=Romanomermis culicivorax TaxID=13658 RepID=A0A915KIE8_ROMCU